MRTWPFIKAKPLPPPKPSATRPGFGLRLTVNALGTLYSTIAPAPAFDHPFRPTLGRDGVRFQLGLVEQLEPKIGDVPISGDARQDQPALSLKASVANQNGESWAMLEVEPNDVGLLTPKSRIEIVHTGDPSLSHALQLGRQPIALILWQDQQPVRAIAITHFHLRYARMALPGGGGTRHYFL
jgi:hypothetical protein